MRALLWIILFAGLAAGAGWYLTLPGTGSSLDISQVPEDVERGEMVFHAAGCASCHAAPEADGEARLVLAGGKRFDTPAGAFYAPNISQDPEHGIGGWSRSQIVRAITEGVSPDNTHYYPAFPYASYAHADVLDIVALADFLQTLPADPTPSRAHELGFPFNIRAGIGLWKRVGIQPGWAVETGGDPAVERGRYLAEALGHCGECHTPRNFAQALDRERWFAGAPNPSGRGGIPNITPAKLDWSRADIAAYLKDGFTPDFDVAGGSMRDVVTSLSNLPDSDLDAIAAYVKAVPPAE